jgi:hypothetical protein
MNARSRRQASPLTTSGTTALAPGTYTRHDFQPRITVTLKEGWFAGTLADGFFDIQRDPGTPDVIAVQFAIIEGAIAGRGHVAAVATIDEAVAAIEANTEVTVIGASESRIGGLTGQIVEVENRGDAHARILQVAPGILGIDPGRRLSMALFDTAEGAFGIMVGGSVARWDETLLAAGPVLESVTIDR